MILQQPFLKLPLRFDADRLRREIDALPREAWNAGYRDLRGTSFLPLIAADDGCEESEAPLRPEMCLERLPYLKQVLGAFAVPVGCARVVRLEPGAGYPPQADTGPYWQKRIQVHVAVLTNAAMRVFCNRQPVQMAPGEAWIVNNGLMHRFVNDSAAPCMHLEFDLEGTPALLAAGRPQNVPGPERLVPYQESATTDIPLEARQPTPPRPTPRFDRPVFIVAAPRSGSTMLFETMAASDAFWTLGGEGGAQVETVSPLAPQLRGVDSNRLTAADLTDAIGARLAANYAADLRDVNGGPWRGAPASLRFLEKTPKNALRIPFFKALFRDAKFIFLYRDAKANISAIIDAWRSGKFVTYTNLPGWQTPWSLLLIPAWRELAGAGLGEVAMRQWRDTNQTILDDLDALPAEDWCAVRYENLVADPAAAMMRLCEFSGVDFGDRLRAVTAGPLKPSRYTLSAPDPEKWRRNEPVFSAHLAQAQSTIDRLAAL